MVPLQAYQYTWGSASRYKGIDISTMSRHLDKQISESVRIEFLNVEVSGEKFRFMQWSTSLQNLDSHLMRTLVSVLSASLPSAQCPDSWKHKHRDHHWPSDQTVMSSSPISLDPAKLYLRSCFWKHHCHCPMILSPQSPNVAEYKKWVEWEVSEQSRARVAVEVFNCLNGLVLPVFWARRWKEERGDQVIIGRGEERAGAVIEGVTMPAHHHHRTAPAVTLNGSLEAAFSVSWRSPPLHPPPPLWTVNSAFVALLEKWTHWFDYKWLRDTAAPPNSLYLSNIFPRGLKFNQLEKLEAAKAAWLVSLSLLSLSGFFWELLFYWRLRLPL